MAIELCRAVHPPAGPVYIIRAAPKARRPGEADDAFYRRVFDETVARNGWAAWPFLDLPFADVPTNRTQRDKWRLQGNQVRVDPTVPDRPHPRQALLDEIEAATTVAALKVAVKKLATA